MKPVVRTIAKEIVINLEWQEIRPMPPLEVRKEVQRISIAVPDIADWDMNLETKSFVKPDGTPVKIDVEILATDGTKFTLDSIGLGPGLTFSYLPPQGVTPGSSRLPKEMQFDRVRVRADTMVEGGRVDWLCITNY